MIPWHPWQAADLEWFQGTSGPLRQKSPKSPCEIGAKSAHCGEELVEKFGSGCRNSFVLSWEKMLPAFDLDQFVTVEDKILSSYLSRVFELFNCFLAVGCWPFYNATQSSTSFAIVHPTRMIVVVDLALCAPPVAANGRKVDVRTKHQKKCAGFAPALL